MNEGLAVVIIGVATIILITTVTVVTESNDHECRMEALKALTDPKLIAEICE